MKSASRKPNFFIVGAPKAATTSMNYYLSQHPDVFMTPNYESWHFVRDMDISAQWYVKDRTDYERLFEDAAREKIVGEKSVLYLYSPGAAQAIHKYNPNARILAILRNPVDLMYSLHRQFVYTGNEEIYEFEEALAAERDRRRGYRIPKSAHAPEALQYRKVVRFTEQVRRYFEIFGRERVKILIYADVKADPQRCFRSVLRFLQVDDDFMADFRPKNVTAAKNIRNLNVRRLLKRSRLARAVRRSIPPWLRPVVGKGLSYVNRGHAIDPRAKMPSELRESLSSELEPEIDELSNLLGRDLSFWRPADADRG